MKQPGTHEGTLNAVYLETLYQTYLKNKANVSLEWQRYFEIDLDTVAKPQYDKPSNIDLYRTYGHLSAELDPLGLQQPKIFPATQKNETFHAIYCGPIGFEYQYVVDGSEKEWLRTRIEAWREKFFTPDEKKRVLHALTAAEGLEKYLHTKYVGQKRFSLEGADSLIPLLNQIIECSGKQEIKEIVIGMAHRGRLNILVNILGKSPQLLFKEFEGHPGTKLPNGSGDVKYHLGFCSNIKTAGAMVHVTLVFNPSHLEIVTPVVMGSVRARQERSKNLKHNVLPIVIHGDAAFAGQGVVMETLNMSLTRGFSVGGMLHLVLNNQIGFTISHPEDARSTLYCTDIAKMLGVPVFHVNGDNPEAVLTVTEIAVDYRLKFHKDVVIDLVCYRRHGHNEADEPAVTQPLMYRTIAKQPTLRTLYAKKLIEENTLLQTEAEDMVRDYRAALNVSDPLNWITEAVQDIRNPFAQDWSFYAGPMDLDALFAIKTKVDAACLQDLAEKLFIIPGELVLHPRVKKIMDDRKHMMQGKIPMDWGYAENLAYASLLNEGYPIRLCGQDTCRGTFFHRHAVLHDQNSDQVYIPLQHLSEHQAPIWTIDSLLSEEAVLAYEYGYASTNPNTLVVWEAQFGDFANGAQVVIDQFVSSGEQKWGKLSGLVLLLPHGYEGQGPEHSSARLERYLQLCAEHNMFVCVPTTPAQIFHLLRRHMHAPVRKPLIVMTPKSLLRHPLATSTLNELSEGYFMPLIPEQKLHEHTGIQRVILCSGKVYYDLLDARSKITKQDTVILRIEQLYPFPEALLSSQLKYYKSVQDIVWCQEEPMNQGAWYSSQHHLRTCLQPNQTLRYAGRPGSASPATGQYDLHLEQQRRLVEDALGIS